MSKPRREETEKSTSNGSFDFDLSNFIDDHLREFKWTSYGLAALATVLIIKNLKATNQFTTAREIPSRFIANGLSLQGHVRNVTDKGVLEIEHIPMIEVKILNNIIKRFKTKKEGPKKYLEVIPAAIDLNEEAIKWMKVNTPGKHAWFQMLARDRMLHCNIKIQQGFFRRLSVSEELVSRGICKVKDLDGLPNGEYFQKHVMKLIAVEHRAAVKGKGIWKEEGNVSSKMFYKAFNWGNEKIKSLLKRR